MRSVTIYPPGHRAGHADRWFWEVIEKGQSVACGTSPDRSEAFDCAELAVMA
jgi:hypothetical protein